MTISLDKEIAKAEGKNYTGILCLNFSAAGCIN
jgi:hypothetical protein